MKEKKRRPYDRPRIVKSEAFERLAVACNGLGTRGPPLKGNPGPNCTTVTTS